MNFKLYLLTGRDSTWERESAVDKITKQLRSIVALISFLISINHPFSIYLEFYSYGGSFMTFP